MAQVVDDNHMYIVYPENDSYVDDIIRMGIRRMHEEEEHRRERFVLTPPTADACHTSSLSHLLLHPLQPLGLGTLTWCGGMVGSPRANRPEQGGRLAAAAQHCPEDLLPIHAR